MRQLILAQCRGRNSARMQNVHRVAWLLTHFFFMASHGGCWAFSMPTAAHQSKHRPKGATTASRQTRFVRRRRDKSKRPIARLRRCTDGFKEERFANPPSASGQGIALRAFKIFSVMVSAWLAFSKPARASDGQATALLGVKNLSAAALMLVSLAAVPPSVIGLPSLSKSLMKSASRCAAQVLFLGSVLLQRMMGTSQPLLVMAWIVGVGFIAGKETFSRAQHTCPAMKLHVCSSILAGGLTVLGLSLGFDVLGGVHPWYQPSIWIPVAGMLFGNALSASALGITTMTKLFATKQGQIELFLARGATSKEATLPLVRDSLLTALTPTTNGLAVTGTVHIPGMMTGQILAGQPAPQAAAYQIMINFLIATTACTAVQLLVKAALGALVDTRNHRLYPNQLTLADDDSAEEEKRPTLRFLASLIPGLSNKRPERTSSKEQASFAKQKDIHAEPMSSSAANETNPVMLKANRLHVPRANANVSFQCRRGDRIGITGKSGAGKSQTLRTLSQLEEWDSGDLLFKGGPVANLVTPACRAKVCLVPQSTQILEGTPHNFCEQVLTFDHQQSTPLAFDKFASVLEKMGLQRSMCERQWSTLSGGEAQRVSLAIALCLEPDVLLLDESTSALDEATRKKVEQTLAETGLPIIMVTHSRDQQDQFCTHQMDLQLSFIRGNAGYLVNSVSKHGATNDS